MNPRPAVPQREQVRLMCDGGTPPLKIAELTCIHISTVNRRLLELYNQRKLYIHDWGKDSIGRSTVRLYAQRTSPLERDARKPTVPGAERTRRYDTAQRARGPFQPHTLWNPHISQGA